MARSSERSLSASEEIGHFDDKVYHQRMNDDQIVEQGRRKLMLRLPGFRQQLAGINTPTMRDLFFCYELTSAALDRFRGSREHQRFVAEYKNMLLDMEVEVSRTLNK